MTARSRRGRRSTSARPSRKLDPLIRTLASLPQPVIAKVNGVAAGAGANIALACDLVIAARSAKFIQSFSARADSRQRRQLAPSRLVGQARALGLALTGDPLPADRAAEWGMIWKAVDDDQLDAEVDAVAAKLASLPPLGLAAIKRIIRAGLAAPSTKSSTCSGTNAPARLHHDYREGVAAFLDVRRNSKVAS